MVWEIAKVELAAFKFISFVVCACDGTGLSSYKDNQILAQDGQGLPTPLPHGIVAGVDVIGFLPLLEGWEVQMTSAFMDFCRARELDWPRSSHDSGYEDLYFPYDFRLTAVSNLPIYSHLKHRQLESGEASETKVVLRGATPLYSSQVSVPYSYEYCCES